MAISDLQPNSATAKNDILKFARSLVSKVTLKALDTLLSPCCLVYLTSVVVVCDPNNTGKYIVTLTLNTGFQLLGRGTVELNVEEYKQGESAYVDGSSVLTFTNVHANPGQSSIGISIYFYIYGLPNYTAIVYRAGTDTSLIDDPIFPTC
jgi:hypothetical protein